MQINSVVNSQIVQRRQNFKGSSASSSPFLEPPEYKPIPSDTSKAYALPQITEGYSEIETFDVPYIGQGKLYKLANGHKIAIVKKSGPTAINTFVKAGSNDSLITSHLLEHLIYNGENNIESKKLTEYFSNFGANTQATTHSNYTDYSIEYPFNDKENIDKLVKAQADLLQNPIFSKEKFEREKNVIFSEYENKKDKYKSNSEVVLFTNKLLNASEDKEQNNYSLEAINRISFEDLLKFYDGKYQNKNMISVVVGNVNNDEILTSFAKFFTKPNRVALPEQFTEKTPINESKRIDISSDNPNYKNINVGFIGPKYNDLKGNFLAIALKIYINDLYQQNSKIKVEMNTLENSKEPNQNSGLQFRMVANIGTEEEKLQEINKFLLELTEKPISEDDINSLKIRLKDMYSTICESSSGISSLIGSNFAEENKAGLLKEYKLIDNLTAKDLQDFTKKYIDFNKELVMVIYSPSKTADTKSPSFKGNIGNINTDNIKEYVYPNNLQLIVDTSSDITRTTFSLAFQTTEIPKTKPGVAEILNIMLKYNAKNSDFAKNNALGIIINSDLGHIKSTANVSPEITLQAINATKDAILYPNFNQELFEKVKQDRKKFLGIISSDFDTKLTNEAYKNYPFKYSSSEMLKNIDDIQLSDVINLYNQIMSLSQGKAILTLPRKTFDENKDNIYTTINKGLPVLQKKQNIDLISKANIKALDKTKIITYGLKDNSAIITQNFQVIEDTSFDTKESTKLKLLEIILGGDRNSKLFKEIRENKGLAYKVGTAYETDGRMGYFSLTTETPIDNKNSEKLQQILDSYKKIIKELINDSISENELNQAKNTLKAKLIKDLEYSGARNDIVSSVSIEDLNNLFREIDAISANDIQDTAKKYLEKPSLFVIKANEDVLSKNRNYFTSIGNMI